MQFLCLILAVYRKPVFSGHSKRTPKFIKTFVLSIFEWPLKTGFKKFVSLKIILIEVLFLIYTMDGVMSIIQQF